MDLIAKMKKQIVVSCQALDDETLNHPLVIQKMALACVKGQAKFLRLSQYEHIKAIKKVVNVPVIELIKKHYENSDVYITPTIEEIKQLISLNVDIIALDATLQIRPKENLEEIVNWFRQNYPKQILLADCSTLQDDLNSERLGFDLIATTLRGYTKATTGLNNIDNNFAFVKSLIKNLKTPIVVEGGIWTVKQAEQLLKLDIHCIVVGSAITRPQAICERFMQIVNKN